MLKNWCEKCKKAFDTQKFYNYCPYCKTNLTVKRFKG